TTQCTRHLHPPRDSYRPNTAVTMCHGLSNTLPAAAVPADPPSRPPPMRKLGLPRLSAPRPTYVTDHHWNRRKAISRIEKLAHRLLSTGVTVDARPGSVEVLAGTLSHRHERKPSPGEPM